MQSFILMLGLEGITVNKLTLLSWVAYTKSDLRNIVILCARKISVQLNSVLPNTEDSSFKIYSRKERQALLYVSIITSRLLWINGQSLVYSEIPTVVLRSKLCLRPQDGALFNSKWRHQRMWFWGRITPSMINKFKLQLNFRRYSQIRMRTDITCSTQFQSKNRPIGRLRHRWEDNIKTNF